jgi:hypothetical protein
VQGGGAGDSGHRQLGVPVGQQAAERDKGGWGGETDNAGGCSKDGEGVDSSNVRGVEVPGSEVEKEGEDTEAWRLSMEAKKLARMTRMLEELSMKDMELEVESIEVMVNEMINI